MRYYAVNLYVVSQEPISLCYKICLFTADGHRYIGGRDYIMEYTGVHVIGTAPEEGRNLMSEHMLIPGDDAKRCDMHFDGVWCCDMWVKVIDADSDDEAFEKFKIWDVQKKEAEI